ncbi:MAG: hypothetical protein QNK37_20955 [Acidobacteriota bacterium]|nr:hypothetical protein [Acidobacteriota bacterium]
MNWLHIARKIRDGFQLQGCFLLNRDKNEWVGEKPPSNFCNYLTEQFRAKPAAYFTEVRFFKLTGDEKTSAGNYLALLPVDMSHVNYNFLGLLYDSPDQLEKLLRFRIMPMYLIFYLHQLVAEARVRNADSGTQKALLRALEEKRLYAQQLESKVKNLHSEIDRVKNAGLSLDQKVDKLTELLEHQNQEYGKLAESYQDLFGKLQEVESEFLNSSVAMECRIHDLEQDKKALETALADKTGSVELVPRARIKQQEERLAEALTETRRLQQRIEELETKAAGADPEQTRRLVNTVKALKQKMDYYRERSEQQETRLKQLKRQFIRTAAQNPRR